MQQQIRGASILTIDDDPVVLALIRAVLERDGFRNVLDVQDPREALEVFSAFEPDLVVLDLQMPELDGFEMLERLRPLTPPGEYLPIVVLTGDISAETRQRALASGARDFVNKPFDPVELALRIRNQLETRILYQQLGEQNARLEDRVRARTAELEAALQLARQASRAKSNFLSVMSHELRTPLASIINYAELLQQGLLGPVTGDQRQALGTVSTAAWHLTRMVEDVLEYADTDQRLGMRWQDADAAELALQAAGMVAPLIREAGLAFRVDVPDAPVPLRTDPDGLRRILLNLLANAARFTPEGEVALTVRAADGEVRATVSDTGVGIAAEQLERIWDPFWQAEEPLTRGTGGAGLGLAIVDRLVAELGGARAVTSTPGKGTTVTVRFPSG